MRIKYFLALLTLGLLSLVAGCAVTQPQQAASGQDKQQDIGKTFNDNTIEFIVPYSAGGGYDRISRVLAPYLEKYLGAGSVVVRNVSGGGGTVGTNTLFAARPNGLTIGIVNGSGSLTNQIVEVEGVNFDIKKFSYLGRVTYDLNVVVVDAASNYKTISDFQTLERPVKVGTTGPGEEHFYTDFLLEKALKFKMNMVSGFPGTTEILLAMQRGELDTVVLSSLSILPRVEQGQFRAILTLENEKVDGLPETQSVAEISLDAEAKDFLQVAQGVYHFGRVIAAPPGLSKDLLGFMQGKFDEMMKDPQVLEELNKNKVSVFYLPGNELTDLVTNTIQKVPAEIVELWKQQKVKM